MLAVTGRKRLLLPLPFALAEVQAWFLQFLPKPPLTPDQVELLKTDNVVSDAAKREGRTLEALGIDADRDGGDRADLSLAVPQDRPVQGQERRHVSIVRVSSRHQCRGPAPDRAAAPAARAVRLCRARLL